MLSLGDLPLAVAAFYVVGSNIIVINENLYSKVLEENPEMVNIWSFRVLLHEYLHILGYQREIEVQDLVREISESLLEGENWNFDTSDYRRHFFPQRRYLDRERRHLSELKIKLIEGFDRSSTNYIT